MAIDTHVDGQRWAHVGRLTVWRVEAWLHARGSEVAQNQGPGRSRVALSGDGTRALVSANTAVRVFGLSGERWTEEAVWTRPRQTDEPGSDPVLVLNADGTRAVVGWLAGGASVYVREAGRWREETSLDAPDLSDSVELGHAVAIDHAGRLVLVGGHGGGARVFAHGPDGWAPTEALLLEAASDVRAFGAFVALCGDGSRALVSGYRAFVYDLGASTD